MQEIADQKKLRIWTFFTQRWPNVNAAILFLLWKIKQKMHGILTIAIKLSVRTISLRKKNVLF